jgi:RNA polymerase sigma factor (sigma-70 family)
MLGSVTAECVCSVDESAHKTKGRLARARSTGGQGKTASSPRASRVDEDAQMLAWVAGMTRRDQAALGQLYDATCSRVHGVVLRIVRRADLAEEVLADVYHQAWRDCHRYDPGRGKVIAWLLIIGRSRSLDALRRADEAFSHPAPEDLLTQDVLAGGGNDPLDLIEAMRGNASLREALESLSALQRQLIALAFFRGLSHAEIAAHARLPLGSVKTHIRKALLQLRDVLTDAGETY